MPYRMGGHSVAVLSVSDDSGPENPRKEQRQWLGFKQERPALKKRRTKASVYLLGHNGHFSQKIKRTFKRCSQIMERHASG